MLPERLGDSAVESGCCHSITCEPGGFRSLLGGFSEHTRLRTALRELFGKLAATVRSTRASTKRQAANVAIPGQNRRMVGPASELLRPGSDFTLRAVRCRPGHLVLGRHSGFLRLAILVQKKQAQMAGSRRFGWTIARRPGAKPQRTTPRQRNLNQPAPVSRLPARHQCLSRAGTVLYFPVWYAFIVT